MRIRYLPLCLLVCVVLNLWSVHSQASGRVLVIHSFHAENEWVQQINAALFSQLKDAKIAYRCFYLDTVRNSDPEWKLKSAQQARQLIETYKPRVVIAIDDNAQAYVTRNYSGDSTLQFVFAGVNADPEFYGFPATNVTGILERTYPGQVLTLLSRIMKANLNVVWISDDSATANLVLKRVREKNESGQLPMPISQFIQPVTFDQWKKTIRKFNADPSTGAMLIPLYHTVKTRVGGPSIPPPEVMKWTVAHTRKPIVGLWPFSTDDGALCAVVVDPIEHGKVAGLMARQILSGKKATDMPMTVNEKGYVIVNNAAAARMGIEVSFEVLRFVDKIIE